MWPYPHERPDFSQLIQDAANWQHADPSTVTFDYWVHFILHHLQQSNADEQVLLKGAATLSSIYRISSCVSQDLKMWLTPTANVTDEQWRVCSKNHSDMIEVIPIRRDWLSGIKLDIPGNWLLLH